MKRLDQEKYRSDFKEQRFKEEDAYLRAKKKLEKIVGFYWHLAVYVIINAFLIIMIVANSDAGDNIWGFGTFATAFFWGIGLMFHFLGVFGPGFIFGKNWEERKIKQFMDKDKDRWQ